MFRLVALLAFVFALLAPPAVSDGPKGEVIWKAENSTGIYLQVTKQSLGDGKALYEVWARKETIYQDYPTTSFGYNGRIVLKRIREIRPYQDPKVAAKGPGMRDPATIYSASRVAWGGALSEGGVDMYIEIRERGEDYIVVVTKILPKSATEAPKSQEM